MLLSVADRQQRQQLDTLISVLSNQQQRKSRTGTSSISSSSSSSHLLQKAPSFPWRRYKDTGSVASLIRAVRSLKEDLHSTRRLNCQLKKAIQRCDSKLHEKDIELGLAMGDSATKTTAAGADRCLKQGQARVRKFRHRLSQPRSEAAARDEPLDEHRQQCPFWRLEELQIQVDEFYAEIVRLRAQRQGDLGMVVQAGKALEQAMREVGCQATTLTKQLVELKARLGEAIPASLADSIEFIADARRRLLHEPNVTTFGNRAAFSRHHRLALGSLRALAHEKTRASLGD